MRRPGRMGTTAFGFFMCTMLILSGCNQASKPAKEGNPSFETSQSNETSESGQGFVKYDPPVEFTVARTVVPAIGFKPGENIDSNVHTRWAKDELGIILNHTLTAAKGEDLDTKLRLALASNEKLPDLISTGNLTIINDFITAGKVQAVDDAIAQYASPEILEKYAKYPEAFNAVKRDGKTYGIPLYTGGMGATVMWIRTDWLDNLNLKPPTTLEELENVMAAFTEKDPDRNGKPDTFGLAIGLMNGIGPGTASSDAIAGMFTDYLPGTWQFEGEQLVYSSVHPSVKPVLEKLKEWLDKGYMNKEAAVLNDVAALDPFTRGQAGIAFGPFHMGTSLLLSLKESNPNARYAAFRIPAGPDGNKGRNAQNQRTGYLLVSKDFKHMDGLFEYYNQMMAARVFGTHPTLSNGIAEGYDYVVDSNGKRVYFDFKSAGIPEEQWPQPNGMQLNVESYFLTDGNLLFPDAFEASVRKFTQDPSAGPETSMDIVVKGWNNEVLYAAEARMADIEHEITDKFTGPPTPTQVSKGELLVKLEREAFSKIIYGQEPMSYFDTYVSTWMKNGGEQITKEVNDWYAESK